MFLWYIVALECDELGPVQETDGGGQDIRVNEGTVRHRTVYTSVY